MLHFFITQHRSTVLAPSAFQIVGCPVGDGRAECSPFCGGVMPISTGALTQAFLANSLNPLKLCGPVAWRVEEAAREISSLQGRFQGEYNALALIGIKYVDFFEEARRVQGLIGTPVTTTP